MADEVRKKQKNLSVEVSSLYSQSSKDMLRISLWNGKLGFSFSKLIENEINSVFFTVDYEKAIILSMIINSIVRDRIVAYKDGVPYQTISIPIEQSYIKDGQLHNVGLMTIKTVAVQSETTDEPVNRICILYEQAGDTFEVTLSSRFISKQILDKYAVKEIDPDDARLFLFAKTLEGVVNNLPVLSYVSKLIDVALRSGGANEKFVGAPQRHVANIEEVPF